MVRLLPKSRAFMPAHLHSFNPTMVRLLRGIKMLLSDREICFNPTMVRLLLVPFSRQPMSPVSFQSHNGAIAAGRPDFNMMTRRRVSIPQWCDCCMFVTVRRYENGQRFNPTMVRLLQ